MLDIHSVPVRTYPATLVRASAYDGIALGRTRLSCSHQQGSAPKKRQMTLPNRARSFAIK